MIKFKKSEKKPVIEQIKKEEISRGRLQVKSEMPDLEKNLSEVVPQARLIKDPDPNNFMNFQVEYTPEKDSLWFGGKYVFSFAFHDDFPMSPPKVMCLTKIYHPNIDFQGNVCLNILKEDWKPTMIVMSCIAGVYYLFTSPNANDPLNHEVANIMRDNYEVFKDNVRKTLRGGYYFNQQFPRFKLFN